LRWFFDKVSQPCWSRALLTKRSQVQISPPPFYLIKIKSKGLQISSSKSFHLKGCVRKLYKSYLEALSNNLSFWVTNLIFCQIVLEVLFSDRLRSYTLSSSFSWNFNTCDTHWKMYFIVLVRIVAILILFMSHL